MLVYLHRKGQFLNHVSRSEPIESGSTLYDTFIEVDISKVKRVNDKQDNCLNESFDSCVMNATLARLNDTCLPPFLAGEVDDDNLTVCTTFEEGMKAVAVFQDLDTSMCRDQGRKLMSSSNVQDLCQRAHPASDWLHENKQPIRSWVSSLTELFDWNS